MNTTKIIAASIVLILAASVPLAVTADNSPGSMKFVRLPAKDSLSQSQLDYIKDLPAEQYTIKEINGKKVMIIRD